MRVRLGAIWDTTKSDEEKLKIFERKILRKIHGPIYNTEAQKWETRSNNQINELYKWKTSSVH